MNDAMQRESLQKAHHAAQLLLADLQEVYQTSSVALEVLAGEMIEQVSRISSILGRLAVEK
ncbi:MAG TPA: hypothetical protein DD670_06840 [Planctomycetaceae bacterium]|nr:hypothetical protein [Planctomycetaceae bacterium]